MIFSHLIGWKALNLVLVRRLLGYFDMPTFLIFGKHTSENCPANNEKTRKMIFEWGSKREGLYKKLGIKSIGGWTVAGEHLSVWVLETPSSEAFQKLISDPEWNSNPFETFEYKFAWTTEEVVKMLKQVK